MPTFQDAPPGSLIRLVGAIHRPVFIKLRNPLLIQYSDGLLFPVNAVALDGHHGEFDPEDEVEVVTLLDLVMSPGEADEEFGKERGTTRAGISRDGWPVGSWRRASKGALLVDRLAAEKKYQKYQKGDN